jgi:hypothetical protein
VTKNQQSKAGSNMPTQAHQLRLHHFLRSPSLCQPLSTPLCACCRLQVLEAVDDTMPPETPLAFGLHPNAEIGFKLREAETFCNSLVQLQPRESGGE